MQFELESSLAKYPEEHIVKEIIFSSYAKGFSYSPLDIHIFHILDQFSLCSLQIENTLTKM